MSLLGAALRAARTAVAGETGGTAFPCDLDRPRRDGRRIRRRARRQRPVRLRHPQCRDRRQRARSRARRAPAFDAIIATNLTAVFDGAQLALPDLLDGRPDKRLIVVASVAGIEGRRLCRALCRVEAWRGRSGQKPRARIRQDQSHRQRRLPVASSTRRWSTTAPRGSAASTKRSDDKSRAALAALNANGRLITADEVAARRSSICACRSSRSINGACVTIDGGTSA